MASQEENKKGAPGFQGTTDAGTTGFTKGLVRDFDENFDPESSWPYARNASNNSKEGDMGLLGNEPSNYLCSQTTYTVIGRVHLYKQFWVIFSTDNPTAKSSSEIGLYDEDLCTYRIIVRDTCLNFSKLNLITGVSKESFDCSWNVYFADGTNPDRVINIGNPDLWPTVPYQSNNYYQGGILWPGVAWNQDCKLVNGCTTCTDLNTLNCDNIRINKLVSTPCIKLDTGQTGGNLSNGSYFAVIGYTVNGQKYGDYTSPSNVQYIFNHNTIGGSLDITISNLETVSFTEFELVIVSIVDQATVARKIGIYNTTSSISINLDYIDDTLTTVPLEQIPLRTPLYETSDSMFETANYLLRIGPRTTFDFNYQPLANQIQSKWIISQYPANYYKDGGYVTGYMRDEVYAFFIRWVYNTGEKSKSYHIPGRIANPGETDQVPSENIYTHDVDGIIEVERRFEITNTADIDSSATIGYSTDDGGKVVAEGFMAYWESTEKYPDRNPEVWNVTGNPIAGTTNSAFDLCNKPIRHHKMPEDIIRESSSPDAALLTRATVTGTEGISQADYINILGVKFNNIKPPVYLDDFGVVRIIPGIVGYEILRGSRQGNKTVIAKGIINNMRGYETPSGASGLYQNFPYNPVKALYPGGASGIVDPSLSLESVAANGDGFTPVIENSISKNFFTFHSPDTSFYKPYLSVKELRLYTEVGADNNVTGNFEEVPGHPKHKILTDLALITSSVIGIAEAVVAMQGKSSQTTESPKVLSPSVVGTSTGIPPAIAAGLIETGDAASSGIIIGANAGANLILNLLGLNVGPANLPNAIEAAYSLQDALLVGGLGSSKVWNFENSAAQSLPTPLRVASGVVTFFNYANTGTNNTLELVEALVKFRQYALRYISHGILHRDSLGGARGSNKRRYINDAAYLTNQYNTFQTYRINNLFRSSTVIVNTEGTIDNTSRVDNSICTVGTNHTNGKVKWPEPNSNDPNEKDPNRAFNVFNSTASCYYAGLKVRFRNQYGQLDSIEQITLPCPITNNGNVPFTEDDVNKPISSPVLFGGDTYIGRYTEKNTFFYFSDWLYNQPDGTPFDYSLRYLGLYPRYWATLDKYDTDGFLSSVLGNISNPGNWQTPANTNNLDGQLESTGTGFGLGDLFNLSNYRFSRRFAYFYLFQSGVRDFYVESEINIAQRDWGELDEQKHYEVLSDLTELFNTNIIKSGNYFKINPSLSISRLYSSIISWGNVQDRFYNPEVAALCYQYLPNRIIYSLPNTLESVKDYWRVFLPNNYKDFKSTVLSVRPIGKNGAMIFFRNDSPMMFQGTETLETDIGTKITIGDGALFSQPMQSIVNSDESYEYGSSQDKFSIINTPTGIYWICQNQGKIFSMVGNLEEVSAKGMRWWFGKFLPFRLLQSFPDFKVTDNPVAGIGCQSIYDNDFQLIYFCKKDYELKPDLPSSIKITYSGSGTTFLLNGSTKIQLGDPLYFNDVSWTVSYDPKGDMWVSFHDWHPDLTMPSKLNFISTKKNTFWRHNDTSASYCNFYGVDYPFQVEYVLDTGQQVNTLKNLEYILESYVYDIDGIDRFQILDYNFDELIVYNTEQVSGKLKLNLAPKDDPFARLTYPKVNIDSIDILYEKKEQKIRVNQFWDITADRGEYNPNVQRPIWMTSWDGYTKELNPANLNYNKSVFERKKFRHYYNNVKFTKLVSGNVKMLMKIANNKNLNSPR